MVLENILGSKQDVVMHTFIYTDLYHLSCDHSVIWAPEYVGAPLLWCDRTGIVEYMNLKYKHSNTISIETEEISELGVKLADISEPSLFRMAMELLSVER